MPMRIRTLSVALIVVVASCPATLFGQQWSGNVVNNPGFEEDFVNAIAESHCISFKGDWYYNQKDSVPDYWRFSGQWSRGEAGTHGGRYSVKLANDNATAAQSYFRAVYQHGGGAWKGGPMSAIPMDADEKAKFAVPWRASVWVKGGSIELGGVAKSATGGGWQQLTVVCPADQQPDPGKSMVLKLTGPGEFDDIVVQQQIPNSPNLISNNSFEQIDKQGYPVGWSQQRKFRAIGPTYYVWTDWNHAFRANRGPVTTDELVVHSGQRSLRFDVYPGDEKFIESDFISLNQTKPRTIEVGVFVRADHIKFVDVRLVNQDGDHMPDKRPREPEWSRGGSFLFGGGTFGWRYVRKTFGCLGNKPVKGVRVRLCARGFNGHTLDDAGTRPYGMTSGTVWWDNIRVMERASDAATLRRRGVKFPSQGFPGRPRLTDGEIDFGERFYGENVLTYRFVNNLGAGSYQLRLTTTIPGKPPVATASAAVSTGAGRPVTLTTPYVIEELASELLKQAKFEVELLRNQQPVSKQAYAFNTWPVVVDVDMARHYSLPKENPCTASLNLGVAERTLNKTRRLVLELYRASDDKVLGTQTITDIPVRMKTTLQQLPRESRNRYAAGPEFNLTAPVNGADHTNLILAKVDLSKLRVWPHNQPVRDTVLRVKGIDAAGKILFSQDSDPFCVMQPAPRQTEIKSVEVRSDGALLINGQPRFISAATHANASMTHGFDVIDQLDLMGHRLTQGKDGTFESLKSIWDKHRIYAVQIKPVSGMGGISPVVDMGAGQRQAFEDFVRGGGMQNVVSINSGGWEQTIFQLPNPAAKLPAHKSLLDWLRRTSKRPMAISTSGAFNAWWLKDLTLYDIVHGETEMWGPMDFNVTLVPYFKRQGRNVAWVYLPQLYDNIPYERYRFETYENIIRGSCGVSMIQGIGDPTFNRGLAGELRYLEAPLNSGEAADVTLTPNISHKATRHNGKTYVLATNAGPIILGDWKWNADEKHFGRASHEGDTINTEWFRPDGIRIHGFRGLQLPPQIKQGDKIVQYVWIDPAEKPDWAMVAVRGDGMFAHNAVLGKFNFEQFCSVDGNILMYSELNHSVWHDINYLLPPAKAKRLKEVAYLMHPGQRIYDIIKDGAESGRKRVREHIYQSTHFHNVGAVPPAGQWHRIEIDAERYGLVGKLVDGFAYLTRNGRALWDHSVLERDGKVIRVFCEDTVGIDRALLGNVRINVPGLKPGTRIRPLFEDRVIIAADGSFTDDFTGQDTYGFESDGVIGDLFGFIKDPNRELNTMIPSGAGYSYGPTAVHIYEIP